MRRRSSGSSADSEGDEPAISEVTQGRDSTGANTIADHAKPSHALSTQTKPQELDRRKSIDRKPLTARSRRPSNTNWKPAESRNAPIEKDLSLQPTAITDSTMKDNASEKMSDTYRRSRVLRSPWSCSPLTLLTTALASLFLFIIVHSFTTRQLDCKGCQRPSMYPGFAKLSDFDTEHTRFASKYSVYLYREGYIEDDTIVSLLCVKSQAEVLIICVD